LTSVLVTGPAGTLGSALILRLVARGHDVRVLVHATAIDCPPAVQPVPGDVRNGSGLLEAVAGVDAVIHAATSPFRRARATEIEGTRRVLLAAGSENAHFVYPSIVGVDQIGGTYYKAKWAAEQMVETAKRWTIQRGTQYHPMIDRMLSHHLCPATSRMAFQPLDVGEFADHLIDIVEEGPAGRAEDFGGPEVLLMREIVAARKAVTKHHTVLIRVPPVGPLRALDAGRNLCPDHARGRMTWQQWLRNQIARSGEHRD
jgi:nucleoside-diphosphate-sugar epimerase